MQKCRSEDSFILYKCNLAIKTNGINDDLITSTLRMRKTG
jgi:hypothetical protein